MSGQIFKYFQMQKTLFPLLFIMFFTVISFSLYAQHDYSRNDSIPVKINHNFIKNAWAGGHNFCQFSEIDLNRDNIKDLFVFDRSGNKITTYINNGTKGSIDYTYAPEFIKEFPVLKEWVLLRDYNCDGKEDIFTHTNSGIKVYRNDSDMDGLKFTLIKNLVYTGYNSPNSYNLYVTYVDIPAILDIDEDGDMDVITYNIFGNFLEFHKNNSQEVYGHCDSLRYELITSCWGNFAEGNAGKIFLNQSCKRSEGPEDFIERKHAGSTLLVIDLNKDGAKDVVIGDVDLSNLTMLMNGGTSVAAHMSSYDYNFPASSIPVDLTLFPGIFYLDVDNDSVKDLLISPNASNISENYNSIWYYKNYNRNDSANFKHISNDFLQHSMIDVGEGAFPVVSDYNMDGKMDLFIGNHGYYVDSGNYKSGLALFENIGTASQPEFELITRDYADISILQFRSVYPAFGDLDGDGDKDMLIGEENGELHFFENTSSSMSIPSYILTVPAFSGIDVGASSTPQLIDINQDGKLDLVIGEKDGSLNYLPNTGTIYQAEFILGNMVEYFGSVDVRVSPSITGFSVPYMFEDSTGKLQLIVGSESGKLFYYDDIDSNLNGSFNLVSNFWGEFTEGARTAVSGYDMDENGKADLFIGNYAGGLSFFENGKKIINPPPPASNRNDKEIIPEIKLFPVPASNYMNIEFSSSSIRQYQLLFYNILGEKIKEETVTNYGTSRINIDNLNDGIYLLLIKSGNIQIAKKITVSKD